MNVISSIPILSRIENPIFAHTDSIIKIPNMKSTFYLLSILAAAAAKASFDSQASGAQVSFPPELFDQSGASPTIQLSAQDSPARFMLNEYDYGTGFESRRRVFSYYPQKAVQASSDSICVGVINGIARGNKVDAPGGKNGGCDGIWGYGTLSHTRASRRH